MLENSLGIDDRARSFVAASEPAMHTPSNVPEGTCFYSDLDDLARALLDWGVRNNVNNIRGRLERAVREQTPPKDATDALLGNGGLNGRVDQANEVLSKATRFGKK